MHLTKLTQESYLAPLRVEPALILYLATPVLNKRHIGQFYVRHCSFSSHFSEYVCLTYGGNHNLRLIKTS